MINAGSIMSIQRGFAAYGLMASVLLGTVVSLASFSFLPVSQDLLSKFFPGRNAQAVEELDKIQVKGSIEVSSNQLLLKFKKGTTTAKKSALLEKNNLREKREIKNIEVKVVELISGKGAKDLAESLRKNPDVEFAETNDLVSPNFVPDDTYFSISWHLPKISAPEAWDKTKASGVVIGVCDTGIEAGHPDLSSILLTDLGFNTVDDNTNWTPVMYHGTLVAGAAAAVVNNGLGVAGVGWDARIIPVRISNLSSGAAYVSDAVECINYSADKGAKVINLSYLMAGYSAIDATASYAESKGAVTVLAAGNDAIDPGWPDFSSFLAVAATDANDSAAWFSNKGNFIDLAAPGVDIVTTYTGSSYAYASGTSLSAPIVTGALALMFGAKPDLSVAEAKTVLLQNADDLGEAGEDIIFGAGRLNVKKAIDALVGTTVPDTTPPTAPSNLVANPIFSSTCCTVVLTWQGSSDNVKTGYYDVYMNNNKVAKVDALPTDPNTIYTYNVDNLFPLTSYSFFVKAVDSSANESGSSNTVTANTVGVKITVSDISMSFSSRGKNTREITAVVTVVDGQANLVPLADVYITLESPSGVKTQLSSQTSDKQNRLGRATFKHKSLEKGTFVVTIEKVVKTGYTYDPSLSIKSLLVN